jgi:hypothetical protein
MIFCMRCDEPLSNDAPWADPCPKCGGTQFGPNLNGPTPTPDAPNTAEKLARLLAQLRVEYHNDAVHRRQGGLECSSCATAPVAPPPVVSSTAAP